MEIIKKKILMLCTQEIIEERNDGGKKASYRLYELIKAVFGIENTTLCMYSNYLMKSEKEMDYSKGIRRIRSHRNFVMRCTNIVRGHLFAGKKEEREICDLIKSNDIDIVLLDRSIQGKIAKEIKREKLNCEIWVFVHNIEKNYFKNKVKHQNKIFYIPYLAVAKSERDTIKYADYIIGLTQRDSRSLQELYERGLDKILPMAFYDTFDSGIMKKNKGQGKKELLFIGSMFPPNYDGIKWFIENVMTELQDISLKIVGKNFERKRKELERENVKVVGTVEDLLPYYYANNIMVMPIFYGDGIKVKTAEAMMYGKIILATDEALNGYDVEGTEGIYRCNCKADFVRYIKELMCEEIFYRESVRNLFLEKYCLDKQIEECRNEWVGK